MNAIHLFLPEQLGNALGWMLVHILWQATGISIITGIALVFLRRRSAQIRYWVANAALATILFAALGTFIYYYHSGGSAVATVSGPAAASPAGLSGPALVVGHATSGSQLPPPGAETLTDYFNRNSPL